MARTRRPKALCRPTLVALEDRSTPAALVRSVAGANAAAVQATVDQFRTDLGGALNPNVVGSLGTGRREINWDGTPDASSAPANLPPDFFNLTSPRGAVFSFPAGSPGTGFQVSAKAGNPTATPVRFGNLNAAYPGTFQTFSPERLFTQLGDTAMQVSFFVPGTTLPATVSGFGAVFADVDNQAARAKLQFFDAAGVSLGTFTADPADNGLSFLGVSFDAGERVARVVITTGNAVAGANDNGTTSDVAVMDDFIYGEPVGSAAASVVSGTGATAADLTATVDQFRTQLGTLNANVPGSVGTGRREINWDANAPLDGLASPTNMPADFFNQSVAPFARGAVFATPGTGVQVSQDDDTPADADPDLVRFDNLNAAYAGTFQTFSAQRLFTAVGSNVVDVAFFVPGTGTPATVSGFGAVFADVDAKNASSLEFFDKAGTSLGKLFAEAKDGGLSFAGAKFAGTPVAKVRVVAGNTAVGPADGGAATDVVVLDDFIYGEPVSNVPGVAAPAGQNAFEGTAKQFDLGTLTDLNTSGNYTVTVDWGDGGKTTFNQAAVGAVTPQTHTYAQDGKFTVTVTAADADGTSAAGSFAVTVANVLPVVTAAAGQQANTGAAGVFALGTFTDPGADAPWTVTVNWGDGTAPVTFTQATAGDLSATHTFAKAGQFTVTTTVADDDGTSAPGTSLVTVADLPAAPAGSTVREAAGKDAAAIQTAVDAFRADIGGVNNKIGGSFGTGRREIDWDGTPAASEDPLPGDFFNAKSARGVILATPGSRLKVSGAAGTPAFEFADVTGGRGPTDFGVFSAPKLFSPIGSTTTDVTFRVPGTTTPAGVRSFGAVFTDVDLANVSKLEFFDAAGNLLLTRTVLPAGVANEGLSFLGATLPAGQLAARVRITSGSQPLGAAVIPVNDAVALDDFIYSEPVPLNRVFVAGTDAGTAAAVRVFNPGGAERQALTPFTNFTGGVRVAEADFNGDGLPDAVVGTGPGVATLVRVLDGKTGAELLAVNPFESTFTGGVFVAAGDINADGVPDLVITPDQGGGPRVRVLSGKDGSGLADFFGIEDANFRGGARAALGDVNGDGRLDVVVAAGFGGGPRLAAFDGKSVVANAPNPPVKLFADFFVFEQTLRNGVFVASGDLDGDGFAEVVAGGGPGGGPRVFALSGKDLVQSGTQVVRANFFAGNVDDRGGIRLAVKDLDGDGRGDVVAGAGAGAGSRVTTYLGKDITAQGTPPEQLKFDAFPGFAGGVFVG